MQYTYLLDRCRSLSPQLFTGPRWCSIFKLLPRRKQRNPFPMPPPKFTSVHVNMLFSHLNDIEKTQGFSGNKATQTSSSDVIPKKKNTLSTPFFLLSILRILTRRSPRFTWTFSFWLCSNLKLNFVKPTLFSLGYDYYASARMVASQLNHLIMLLLKRPLTHNWTSPLMSLVKCLGSSFILYHGSSNRLAARVAGDTQQ